MDRPHVLLTNDDGIGAVGLSVLAERLASVADVTVVAPTDDHSGVGRANSREATVERRDRGYALDGTPVDCVAFGLRGLDCDPDAVVAGCNQGPNIGMHNLDRSGTASAAMEAAFLGTPGIAVSAYHPVEGGFYDPTSGDFEEAAAVTAHLVEEALGPGTFERVDWLNVNAPTESDGPPEVRVTRPALAFDVAVERDGERVSFTDRFPDPLRPDHPATLPDDEGETDRRALARGDVSVSPLRSRHEVARPGALAEAVDGYRGGGASGR